MKGIFRLRTRKTKYRAICDIQILLEFPENISLDNDMDLRGKIVCYFMVLSGFRVKTMSKLSKAVSDNTALLITTVPPYKGVLSDTIVVGCRIQWKIHE